MRACALLLLCCACGPTELDTTRLPSPSTTLGEDLFGVVCDRMGAQLLPEDLTGASFRDVCHRGTDGEYARGVDTTRLLPGVAQAEALARMETLARHRPRVVAALDALLPDTLVPVKDVSSTALALTCGPATPEQARLHEELASLLERMTAMYGDGTLPDTTRELGTWLESFARSAEATQAWAEQDARQGYQPRERVLGALRPLLAYPDMRDLLDAGTRALAPGDSPGPVRPAFTSIQEVVHHTLRTLESGETRSSVSITHDALEQRDLPSRPRTPGEWLSTLLLTETGLASSTPVLVPRIDRRGVAVVNSVGAPFTDANADGLPDVDGLGRFVPGGSSPVPLPFFVPGVAESVTRDANGRALAAPGGPPLYAYVDARRTLLGQLVSEVPPMLATEGTPPRSTVTELLDGLHVLWGPRDGSKSSTRTYPPVTVAYDAFHGDEAPLLDLLHVGAQWLGQPAADDPLQVLRALVMDHPGDVARLVALLRTLSRTADAHPEARLKEGNTLRDDLVDVLVEISREPGMLEELLEALARPDSQGLGPMLASFLEHRDRIDYDRDALNGAPRNLSTGDHSPPRTAVDRTRPDTGLNRSMFARLIQLLHDANGVALCNKADAVVHARGVPLVGSLDMPLLGGRYKECEVFKIDNMAVFYLRAMMGEAHLYLRPSILRGGIIGIGAATANTLEQSSGITGFWSEGVNGAFRPKAEWVGRMLLFDQVNDSPTAGGKNYITNRFLKDLMGMNIGSSVCPERVIPDPDPSAPDASPDGKVRGLRNCAADEWLPRRDPDTLLMLETGGSFKALRPVFGVFMNRGREDLFIRALEVLHRHWMSDLAPPGDCAGCSRAGVVRYEPLAAELLRGDVLGSTQALVSRLQGIQVPHCTKLAPDTKQCTHSETWGGVKVMAELVREAIDPVRAQGIGLRDRRGGASHVRQDGVTREQVTLLSLGLDALSALDTAFDRSAAEHPEGPDRRAAWSRALSRLAAQWLTVRGERETSAFAHPLVTRLIPPALDSIRSELSARCPETWAPPHARCTWMRDELVGQVQEALEGPLFATAWDFLEAVRRDEPLRRQVETLVDFILNPDDQDLWPALLATAVDGVQLGAVDAPRRAALAHFLAETLKPGGLVDATLVLGRRMEGKVYAEDGTTRVCAREMDPNDLLLGVLERLGTPIEVPGEETPRTPWEVLTEAVVDIQRIEPGRTEARSAEDYQRISRELASFLLDPEHGLERFYAVANQSVAAP